MDQKQGNLPPRHQDTKKTNREPFAVLGALVTWWLKKNFFGKMNL
jgi:hypothetical protein